MESNTSTNTTKNHRARWAAIGAAVAVSIGAGGIGLVGAASPDGASMLVGTEPCRLLDTRPGSFHIGPYDTLDPDSNITVEARGDVGECTGPTALPNNASGLQLNVTPIGATQDTNLRVYPGDGPEPNASNLNPVAGQRPIPNAVTVELDDNGLFSIYNFQGNVDIAVDVVGYYTDNFTIDSHDITNEAGVARSTKKDQVENVGTADTLVSTVRIRPPASGLVTVVATADWWSPAPTADGEQISCQITDGTSSIDGAAAVHTDTAPSNSTGRQTITTQRTFDVDAWTGILASGQPFNLVCDSRDAPVTVDEIEMTATYHPSGYGPLVIVVGP